MLDDGRNAFDSERKQGRTSSTPRFYAMDGRLVVAACAMHN